MMLPPPFVLIVAAGLAALALGALALAAFEFGRRSGARAVAAELTSRAELAEDRAALLEAAAARDLAEVEAYAIAARADAERTTLALLERAEELEAQFRSVKSSVDGASEAAMAADARAAAAEARIVSLTETSSAAVAAAEEQARQTVAAAEASAQRAAEHADLQARTLIALAEASAREALERTQDLSRAAVEEAEETALAATMRAQDAERHLADALLALVESRKAAAAETARAEAEQAALHAQVEGLREARRADAEAWASTARQLEASRSREADLQARRDALTALARRVARQDEPEVLEAAAAELLAATLHVDLAGVFDLDAENKRAVLRAGAGWRPEQLDVAVMHVMEGGLAARALEADAPVVVEQALAETRFLVPPVLVAERVVCGVTVRIPGLPHPAGVLGVYAREERSFSEADTAFIAAVAAQLGTVAARRRAAQAQRLAELRTTLVLETVEDALLLADQRGRVVAASGSAETFFAAEPRGLSGRPLSEMLESIDERSFDLTQALAKEWAHPNGGVRGWLVARRGDASLVPARIWAGVRKREGTGHVLLRLTAASQPESTERAPEAQAAWQTAGNPALPSAWVPGRASNG
jgi:hypothetical protein